MLIDGSSFCSVLPALLFSVFCGAEEIQTEPVTEQIFHGHYIWGGEVHTFSPCTSDKTYWVSFDWAGREMQNYYKAHLSKPYQPMFISFRGQILNEQVDGFALQYDGLVRISEVKRFWFWKRASV